jgi:DNA (cytosine-5)-methyltransferase 1
MPELLISTMKPWRTVRDVISDLPAPWQTRTSEEPGLTHFSIPGARTYIGHTGSPLDEPAKTLKAGDHGVPGGENMLANPDGSVRYFTIRESARLQTFPDEYVFPGSWTESMRQIGNAVPVDLARSLAADIHKRLNARFRN